MRLSEFFRRIGEAVLHPRLPRVRLRLPRFKLERKGRKEVPRVLRGFFEARHACWPEYLVLKAQLALLTAFLLAIGGVIYSGWLLPLLLALLSAYLLHLLPDFREAFGSDYQAYRAFILLSVALPWTLLVLLRARFYYSPFLALCFLLVSFTLFRVKYGRDWTYGTVESVQGRTVSVRVGYDIRSNVGAGLHVLQAPFKVRKGERVKLRVERPFLGLRGSRVVSILQKSSTH
ncbi:MAG: DUF2101 family protein [Candidatus Hadarchaeales archaeon]